MSTHNPIAMCCLLCVVLAMTGCARDRLEPQGGDVGSDTGRATSPEDVGGGEDADAEPMDSALDMGAEDVEEQDTFVDDITDREGDADEDTAEDTAMDVTEACDGSGVEVCDGLDDDCDGEIDEGVRNGCGGCAALEGMPGDQCGACGVLVCDGEEAIGCEESGEPAEYWLDGDMDGYGEGEPRTLCGPVGVWTATQGGDCQDGDPRINPGEEEVCDALDNDCDPDSREADVCQIMVLSAGEEVWQGYTLDPIGDSEHAPNGDAVRGAFVLEEAQEVWVLTQQPARWHRASLESGEWVDSGDLYDQFGSLILGTIRGAYAVPSIQEGESTRVTIYVGRLAHLYEYDGAGFDFESIDEPNWRGQHVPDLANVQAVWREVDHTLGWYDDVDLSEVCDSSREGPPQTVLGHLADEQVHVYEAEHCLEFVESPQSRVFEPFTYDTAPDPDDVRAAFWRNGLVVFQ